MEFRKISSARNSLFESVWSIYEESFPLDERRTKQAQEKIFKEKKYQFYAIREGSECMGLLAAWNLKEYTFVEHFAIRKDVRSRGLGSQAMHAYCIQEPKLVLETERPTSEIAQRRIEFWKRAGFKLNTYNYVQPPYGSGKNPVPMYLMTAPSALTDNEFYLLRNEIHKTVYGLKSPLLSL